MRLQLTNALLPRGKLYEYRLPREWIWYREGHEDKMFREKKAKETFQAGLQYLPFFLGEAMADEDLIAYLRRTIWIQYEQRSCQGWLWRWTRQN